MKVYLAGPMSGIPDFNRPAFHAAAAILREAGHTVFSPAEVDLFAEIENYSHISADDDYRKYMRVDLSWICDHAEAIALMPGWTHSSGARTEKALADALGLHVMHVVGVE